jgi:hypothetical protein
MEVKEGFGNFHGRSKSSGECELKTRPIANGNKDFWQGNREAITSAGGATYLSNQISKTNLAPQERHPFRILYAAPTEL